MKKNCIFRIFGIEKSVTRETNQSKREYLLVKGLTPEMASKLFTPEMASKLDIPEMASKLDNVRDSK